jgi:hypothetical protein
MEKGRSDNVERLREAGLIKEARFPEPYHAVIDDLSDAEIDVLIKVKRRLDEEREYARESDDDTPDYVDYMVPL